MPPRRRSVDSSDSSCSSSSSDSDSSHKKHKAKKDKKSKDKKRDKFKSTAYNDKHHPVAHASSSFPPLTTFHTSSQTMSGFPDFPDHTQGSFQGGFPEPPQYQAPPPSGFRVPLSTDTPFPQNVQDIGEPAFFDAGGSSPIFIGSALMEKSVHPCKIGPHLQPYASVPYGGGEHGHHGRYDLLPFRPHEMEWVRTSHGQIPVGRRPVEGGYEENGAKLYHAAAPINGVMVPGKAGEHLGGCHVAFGGVEHEISGNYEILCWR